mgnify:CR=1 FL=1
MSSVSTFLTGPASVFLLMLAMGGLIYFVRRFGAAWAMRRWPRTSGRVLTAEMRRGRKKSSDGSLMYDPVLRYSYTVGHLTFESSRFTHRTVRNAAQLATQFILHIPKNAEVPVYYHPRNPAEAVVQPLPWRGAAVGAGVCTLLLLVLGLRLSMA